MIVDDIASETIPISIDKKNGKLYFSDLNEFLNRSDLILKLNIHEYLLWEDQLGISTIYGDYVRARLESYNVNNLDDYELFKQKWKGKVKITDLTKVDYFEVYPKINAPIRFLKLIDENWEFSVGENNYKFFEKNYVIYKTGQELEKFKNLTRIHRDNENKIFSYPYKMNILQRRTSDDCSSQDDHGGFWCYARRVKGLWEGITTEFVENGIYTVLREHEIEVRAARKQSGVWWAETVDEVSIDYDMGAELDIDGTIYSYTAPELFTDDNASQFDWTKTFASTDNFPNSFHDDFGDSKYRIIKTAGSNCSPQIYDLDCFIFL